MPAHRKTTLSQITELLEYLEKHRLGSAVGKKENHHWELLAKILNKLPGEPKDASKWKNYWNELKWHCRKKANDGRALMAHEKRVLNLAGTVKKYPMLVLPDDRLKIELKDDISDQDHNTSEQGDDNTEMDFESSRVLGQDLDDSIPDPMSTVDISVHNYQSDQDDQPDEVDNKANIDLPNEDVPEWVRKVEHSRLMFEERTTLAIEQMAVGISTIAESLQGIMGSLHNIEDSIRSLKSKN